MAIQDFFNSMENSCHPVTYSDEEEMDDGQVLFSWSAKGVGFGQLYFYFKEEDGTPMLHCDNEGMSKEFIKKMLCCMVDEAIMNDPNAKDLKDE